VYLYPTLTAAPPCWLQLPPTVREWFFEEDSEEEKESISKVVVVFVIATDAVFFLLHCPIEHRALTRGHSLASP
jgi:hypothetical protein